MLLPRHEAFPLAPGAFGLSGPHALIALTHPQSKSMIKLAT
jgi:hypothetical protein